MAAHDSDLEVFAYAVAEKSEQYVAVIEALVTSRERFRLQLRPGEVAADVRAGGSNLDQSQVSLLLEQLADWGNVSRFYDSAAPETLAEFYNKRYLYQLTPRGSAAHDGVRAAQRAGLAVGGRLSGVLLPGILERLEAIRVAAAESEPDAGRLYSLFVDLFGSFGELAENSARYMSDLAVQVSDLTSDDERFLSYKQAVFAYLSDFMARFDEILPPVQALVAALDPGIAALLEVAAGADVAPTLAGADEGPLANLRQRWSGVVGWFLPGFAAESGGMRDRLPVAESLKLAMLEAINRILMAVTRLNEQHFRRASREADFVQLARWFAAIDDPGADGGSGGGGFSAQLLWDYAFGLWGARHFSDAAGDEEVERRRSFWEAEPAQIAPRLRATGRRAGPGRFAKASDYRAVKLARVALVRCLHAQALAATTRLAGRTPARLSDLGPLDPEEFDQFLLLLDAALGTRPAPDGARAAVTPLVALVLRPVDGGGETELRTPAGTLRCPDYHLEIHLDDAEGSQAHDAADVTTNIPMASSVGGGATTEHESEAFG